MHEHYDNFGLINMKFTVSERSAKLCLSNAERCELGEANGRLYAPILSRMLSPDVVIQDQYNSQAYNAYSYCLNNPLRFTDPSGYVVEIPPEFLNMFTYAQNKDIFKDFIVEMGIDPSTVQYNTTESQGIVKSVVSWYIDKDRYEITKYENTHIRDYYQCHRKGCAAKCFEIIESQWDYGNTSYDESYYMNCDPNSYNEGLSVRKLSGLFVGEQIGDNYYPGISNVYNYYNELEITDNNRDCFLEECYNNMKDNNAVMYVLKTPIGNHTVNATIAAELRVNGRTSSNNYSFWIWDSSKIGGGIKHLDTNEVLYRFIFAK